MKTSLFHSFGDIFHAIDGSSGVFCVYLGVNKIINVIRTVYHDFAHKHVFQVFESAIISDTMESFMGFEEI